MTPNEMREAGHEFYDDCVKSESVDDKPRIISAKEMSQLWYAAAEICERLDKLIEQGGRLSAVEEDLGDCWEVVNQMVDPVPCADGEGEG
jgi:hypothetical protein